MWRLIFCWEAPSSSWSSMIETSALRSAKAAGGKAESAAQRAASTRTAEKAGVRECLLLVKAIGPGARGGNRETSWRAQSSALPRDRRGIVAGGSAERGGWAAIPWRRESHSPARSGPDSREAASLAIDDPAANRRPGGGSSEGPRA